MKEFTGTKYNGRTFTDYKAPKTDKNGIPYPCSKASATVNINWAGKADGTTVALDPVKKENVPYYADALAYSGSRPHQPGESKRLNEVPPTVDTPGSYDLAVYCEVFGEEISRETKAVDPLIKGPAVQAAVVNYNTMINVTWDTVEGAGSYELYYRSANLGVTTWIPVAKVTGTSYRHSGLVTGAKYRYTVSAVKDGKCGEYGRKTVVATTKLTTPVVKSVTSVKKGINVTWSKVDGISGYIIQAKTSNGKWTRVATVKKGAKVSWTDKKVAAGTTYRVRAYRTIEAANFSKNNV